jgi:hypothetical protein
MTTTALIQATWDYVALGRPLFVARKEREFLCEGPYERMDLGGKDQPQVDDMTESCIRVFLTRGECEQYCRLWREMLDVGPENQGVRVMPVALNTMWTHLHAMVANSYFDYTVPCRIDICALHDDEYPVCIDTLFSEREEMN